MAKQIRKDNGAPQNAGDSTAAPIDRDLEDWLTAERELNERGTRPNQGQ
jgi:hypothetical protein